LDENTFDNMEFERKQEGKKNLMKTNVQEIKPVIFFNFILNLFKDIFFIIGGNVEKSHEFDLWFLKKLMKLTVFLIKF